MSYIIQDDYENYYSITMDVSDLTSKMPHYSQKFRATPRLNDWVAPKTSFYAGANYKGSGENIPDITTWALGNLVMSPKAYQALKVSLEPSGEFLPLIVGDETYYMFNTLFVVPDDAIDYSDTVDVIESGVHMGKEHVNFDESKILNHLIFKSKTNKLTFSFATEQFKAEYLNNNFTGLVFKTTD